MSAREGNDTSSTTMGDRGFLWKLRIGSMYGGVLPFAVVNG
jgi:hypothetical protein